MQETVTNSLESKHPQLLARFSGEILGVTEHRGDLTVIVKPGRIREILAFLKKENAIQFNMMMDLFAVDYLKYKPETPERFAVIYNLYSLLSGDRLFVKVWISETKPEIDSIHDLYKMVNWFEREAWDLFGIVFKGHPNLIRILCHNEFVGHPLRKDYPSDGYQRLKNAAPSTGI